MRRPRVLISDESESSKCKNTPLSASSLEISDISLSSNEWRLNLGGAHVIVPQRPVEDNLPLEVKNTSLQIMEEKPVATNNCETIVTQVVVTQQPELPDRINLDGVSESGDAEDFKSD